MKTFVRNMKFTLVAAALGLFVCASSARAGSYQDVTSPQTVQATDGTIWTVYRAGGYSWGIPATDPGFNAYTSLLAVAAITGHHIQTGCVNCYVQPLTSPALTGTWQVWYPQWITPLPF
ncbi:MAG TPA: hypothetical protein VI456_15865 [Polyangia bacterium]